MKEAGTLLGPVVIMIIFPALFTQVINLDGIESFWFAIPLVNILLAMRELLLDRVIFEHVIIWLISSIIYATLAALYAAKQFKREDLVASISNQQQLIIDNNRNIYVGLSDSTTTGQSLDNVRIKRYNSDSNPYSGIN